MRTLDATRLTDSGITIPAGKASNAPYAADAVLRLRGSLVIEHALARHGAERLWDLLRSEPFVPALGA